MERETDPHPRLRLAVHAADRAAAARAVGLLRDPAPGHQGRVARPRAGRGASCSRAGRTACTSGAPRAATRGSSQLGRARGRHLLRHAAHEPRARRRGEALRPPRVRPGDLLAEAGRHALPRACRPRSRVWMSHGDDVRRAPRGVPGGRGDRDERDRRHRGPGAAGSTGCCSTPRWSTPRRARKVLVQLPRRLRLPPRLERPRRSSRRRPSASASRWAPGPGDLRAVGRRRLRGGGAARAPGDRRPAHLRLRGQRPAAQGRGGAGPAALRRAAAPQGGLRRRLAPLPGEARAA